MWGRARNRGLGQGVGVKGGQLKLFTSDCSTYIAVGRDVGLWGWGNDGGGEGGGEGDWGEAFIEVLNKTGIVTRLGCRNERYDTKLYTKLWGIPDFWGNPPVMTSRSQKYVIISPKKSPKTRRREISPYYLCKKEQPSWKTEKNASL